MTAARPISPQVSTVAQAAAVPRWRLILAKVLVALVTLLAFVSVLAGYVRYQALDTGTVKDTAGQLIADDAIRTQIAGTLVDQLYSNVDVAAALRQRLPPQQKGLAAPLAGALRGVADRSAAELLQRPRIQAVWVQSVANTHAKLVQLLDNRGTALRTENGDVVLDLRPLVIQLGNQVAIVGNLADRLPPGSTQIEIMRSDQLRTAQRATHLLNILARFLWIITLAVAALAVWLARGRRRATLRSLAVGLIIAGFLVLVIRRVAGTYIVDSLVPPGSAQTAVSDSWTIVTALLADGGRTLVGLGLIALVGLWFAGEMQSARSSRRELAPLIARAEIAYGFVATFLLLLVWWAPTVQLRRLQLVIAFAVLLAAGMWAVRRLTLAENPEAASQPAGLPFAHSWAAARRRPTGTPNVRP